MSYERTQVIPIHYKPALRSKVEQAYGNARFTYNWTIAVCDERYNAWCEDKTQARPSISFETLNAEWTRVRPAFMQLSCRCGQTRAIRNAVRAYFDYFKDRHKPSGARKKNHPKKHKKGQKESCYFTNEAVKIKGKYIKLFKIGWVRLAERVKIDGRLLSCTLKRHLGMDYVHLHFTCAGARPSGRPAPGSIVAIDVGLKNPAVAVNNQGEIYRLYVPESVKTINQRIKREQHVLDKRQKNSKRWEKQKRKVQKLHKRKADIRRDVINKFTSYLTKSHEMIVTESLECTHMRINANKGLRRALSESSMSELLKEIQYKAHIHKPINRYFASTKTCPKCGHVKETMPLSERIYHCDVCGWTIDRDVNAAINLFNAGAGSPSVLVERSDTGSI